ncbi:MAG: FliM/FliN family flagellar motor switch protein [Planctomycetota bacterium]|nr:FliM/FliN family flagellar motor switch protein [Planctomycetota bacterium]
MTEKNNSSASAQPAAESGGDREKKPGRQVNVEQVLDIQVPVVAILAQKDITLREALQLTVGNVIQFEKSIEEPIDLLVNNVAVANGNTVKVGERFGLQIRETAGPSAAVNALGPRRG